MALRRIRRGEKYILLFYYYPQKKYITVIRKNRIKKIFFIDEKLFFRDRGSVDGYVNKL
jgi:hypothetical protein